MVQKLPKRNSILNTVRAIATRRNNGTDENCAAYATTTEHLYTSQWIEGRVEYWNSSEKSRKSVVNVSMEAEDIQEDTAHRRLCTCCSELQCVWICDSTIDTCSSDLYMFNKSNYQSLTVYSNSYTLWHILTGHS
jgi:hypothetical protein